MVGCGIGTSMVVWVDLKELRLFFIFLLIFRHTFNLWKETHSFNIQVVQLEICPLHNLICVYSDACERIVDAGVIEVCACVRLLVRFSEETEIFPFSRLKNSLLIKKFIPPKRLFFFEFFSPDFFSSFMSFLLKNGKKKSKIFTNFQYFTDLLGRKMFFKRNFKIIPWKFLLRTLNKIEKNQFPQFFNTFEEKLCVENYPRISRACFTSSQFHRL